MAANAEPVTPPRHASSTGPAFLFYTAPVTVFVQYENGTQAAFTPMPQVLLQPLSSATDHGTHATSRGIPMIFSASPLMDGSTWSGLLHELFERSQQEVQGPPPTSKSFLDKLPVKVWSSASRDCEKHVDCPICLCEYESKDEVIALPCGHLFHKDCGLQWLVEHNVCPTCRHQLPTQKQDEVNVHHEAPAAVSSTANAETLPVESSTSSRRRVRQQLSPQNSPQRVRQRRRLGSDLTLPGAMEQTERDDRSSSEDALDQLLEEEASRFVAEQNLQQHKTEAQDVNMDDIDVEELLRS